MYDDYSVKYEKRHTRHGLIMDGDCWEVVRIMTDDGEEEEEIVAVVNTETMADTILKMLEDE